MKNIFVILFAVVVTVTSAAHIPADSRPALAKLEPVLQKIIDRIYDKKNKIQSEDVFDSEAMADSVPEVSLPEEFREKPTNLKSLLEKIESIEKQKVAVAAPEKEIEDESDNESEVQISFGLDMPIKYADAIKANENESNDNEEEMQVEDNRMPISFGVVEEAVDIDKEADEDVQVSFGLAEPILYSVQKNVVQDDDDEKEEEEESDVPFQSADEEEQSDDGEVQMSFGLNQPIKASDAKNSIQDDEEDQEGDSGDDVNEKFMSEVINAAIRKFAQSHGLKI